ncbi:MAG: DbpA RNA binding domain-containing protein, partial [Acidobacteriota bacterium]
RRVTQFKQLITETLETQDLDFFNKVIDSYQREQDVDLPQVASALAYLVQRERPLRTPRTFRTPRDSSSTASTSHGSPHRSESRRPPRHGDRHDERHVRRDTAHREDRREDRHRDDRYREDRHRDERHRDERRRDERRREEGKPRRREHSDIPMVRYRIEVGRSHGVQPGNIVGAISNEAELDGQHIGHITLYDNFSLVELPDGMPRETYKHLQSVQVCGQALRISRDAGSKAGGSAPRKRKPTRKEKPRHSKLRGKKRVKMLEKKKRGKPGKKQRESG